MKNFQKAFTLAEALVALGIVGIVAALTIPALVTNVSRSHVGPSLGRAVAAVESGCLKVVQDDANDDDVVNPENAQKCIEDPDDVAEGADAYKTSAADATTKEYKFYKMRATYTVAQDASEEYTVYTFDVNGQEGKNTTGVDQFEFKLLSNGKLQPTGLGNEDSCPATPANCAAKVVADGYRVTYDIN